MKCIVVAYDKNRAIGKQGDLPWGRALKADLRRFKALTLGKTVVMGRKTFESIGFALPDRQNIVISRQDGTDLPGSVLLARTIDEAYQLATDDIYVIGGASIYEQMLPGVDVIYATEVDAEIDGVDTYFTALDPAVWHETSRTHHEADSNNAYSFDFVTYSRA